MDRTPGYNAIHARLRKARGRAADLSCMHCGDTARDWALAGEPKWFDPRPYTDDLDAYVPLCNPCHIRLDRGLPPCPHGPERDRLPKGACRLCYNETSRAYAKARYANDPEYRERIRARSHRSYMKRTGRVDTT